MEGQPISYVCGPAAAATGSQLWFKRLVRSTVSPFYLRSSSPRAFWRGAVRLPLAARIPSFHRHILLICVSAFLSLPSPPRNIAPPFLILGGRRPQPQGYLPVPAQPPIPVSCSIPPFFFGQTSKQRRHKRDPATVPVIRTVGRGLRAEYRSYDNLPSPPQTPGCSSILA